MRFLLYLFIFSINLSSTTTSDVLTTFNITIKTPGNELPPTQTPYKSIHMKYTVPDSDNQWNIVAIESFIQASLKGVIQQITVHICQTTANTYQKNLIWYDDETNCNGALSMLIYNWITNSSLSTFRVSDGFQLDKSKYIIVTITYSKERQSHNHQAGVILNISTLIPRFYVGTILVGNNQGGNRFSCRSSNYARLLYAVKPLFRKSSNEFWHIYIIRTRSFGRKVVQLVVDSTKYLGENKTDLEMVSPDLFVIPDDYITVECREVWNSNCQFLIYYTYKNVPYKYYDENDYTCRNDNHPDLFKLIQSKTINETNTDVSSVDGTTILLLVCLLLFIVWLSIIIGCVIMRRIRGLVNFHTEPSSPYLQQAQSTKGFFAQKRAADQNQQKLIAEGDHIAQLDVEHMGLS